jgi:hypothetical protein
MTVDELNRLAKWVEENLTPNLGAYDNLATVLKHNAEQNQKQPLKSSLEELQSVLLNQPIEELTIEQADLLKMNQISTFVGTEGLRWLKSIVTEGEYDPASAAGEMRSAYTTINRAIESFDTLTRTMRAIGIVENNDFSLEEGIIARIHFKGNAAITDIVKLKKWSADWNDIARGLAMAVDERPEDVRVVGASTGSVIMILCVTLSVAKILVSLSKSATAISMNTLNIANSLEDLRHKKVLNKGIEEAMRLEINRIKSEGVATALTDAKKMIPGKLNNTNEKLLETSVEKYLAFTEHGGEIDMLAPPDSADEEFGFAKEVEELKLGIQEVRKIKAEVQLLISQRDDGVA